MSAAPTVKPFYFSKTFWTNVAAAASLAIPQVQEWLESNPVELAAALAAVNVLLRFVTRDKLSLGLGGKRPGGGAPVLVSMMLAAAALFAGLSSSCAFFEDMTVDGSAYLRDAETGAKAGLVIRDGSGRFFGRVPVFDNQGNQVGAARVEIGKPIVTTSK